jgi:hypothetical protein
MRPKDDVCTVPALAGWNGKRFSISGILVLRQSLKPERSAEGPRGSDDASNICWDQSGASRAESTSPRADSQTAAMGGRRRKGTSTHTRWPLDRPVLRVLADREQPNLAIFENPPMPLVVPTPANLKFPTNDLLHLNGM